MASCTGCGRLLGLYSEAECACWLSVSDKGIVPERIRTKTQKYKRIRTPRGGK